VKGTGRNLF